MPQGWTSLAWQGHMPIREIATEARMPGYRLVHIPSGAGRCVPTLELLEMRVGGDGSPIVTNSHGNLVACSRKCLLLAPLWFGLEALLQARLI